MTALKQFSYTKPAGTGPAGLLAAASSLAMLAIFLTVLPSGCFSLLGDFGDLEDETFVHESSEPDGLQSATYPTAFAFSAASGGGTDFIALGRNPSNVALLNFGADGGLSAEAKPTPDGFGFEDYTIPPPTAGLSGDSGNQSIVVGLTAGTSGGIGLYSPAQLAPTITVLPTPMIPSGLAYAPTSAAGGPGADIIAVGDGNILTFGEGNFTATPSSACTLVGATNVASGDFLSASAGDEIVIVTNDQIQVLEGTALDGDPTTPPACTLPGTPITASGNGEADFGRSLAVGDFDGNGELDVAASATAATRVYVFFNLGGTPSMAMVSGDSGFGSTIAAGDLDGDGQDELIVGVPNGAAKGVAAAGRVDIFQFTGTTPGTAIALTRAEPESNETYGAAVAVATFGGSKDLVLVGGNKNVFVNFRHPIAGDTDPRN